MGGESGVECRGDCAAEHGRRRRERTGAGEYRGGRAEEVENGVLLWVKTQRDGARREARRIRVGERRFMRQKSTTVENEVGFLQP
jgi:hypothetical protein